MKVSKETLIILAQECNDEDAAKAFFDEPWPFVHWHPIVGVPWSCIERMERSCRQQARKRLETRRLRGKNELPRFSANLENRHGRLAGCVK